MHHVIHDFLIDIQISIIPGSPEFGGQIRIVIRCAVVVMRKILNLQIPVIRTRQRVIPGIFFGINHNLRGRITSKNKRNEYK